MQWKQKDKRMEKLRNWMKGNGRTVVILVLFLCSLAILVDYYRETHSTGTVRPHSPAVLSPPEETGSPLLERTENVPGGTPKAGKNPKNRTDIRVGMAGDICLDERSPAMKHMRKKGEGIAGCIDSRLIRRMKGNDFMILNNEFSISDRGKPMKGKAYTFRAPVKNAALLQKLGVDAVSLANNHVFDYGKTAFLDTLSSLKGAGIKYTGGGKNKEEAQKPLYLTCRGKTIALVAATRAEKYIMTPEAGKNSPGVFRTYNDREYVAAIRRADKKADAVIAFVHWGTEYSTRLEPAQKRQAEDYIDAGADVVVGAHTHCMQGVGYYKGKPIFYSLGNLWFNGKTLYTALLQLTIKENGTVEAAMVPCVQSGKETRLLKGKRKVNGFLKYINRISTNGRVREDGHSGWLTVFEKGV